MNASYTELENIFAKENLRLTSPRRAIFNALKQADKPLAASKIITLCPTVDKTSVYRTIELFSKLQIITSVTVGWKIHYELVGPFKSHHHHLHCTHCDKIIDVHSDRIEALITDLSEDYSFTPKTHQFEIHGICSTCSSASKNKTKLHK